MGESILGFHGIPDDCVPRAPLPGIVADGNDLRDACVLFQEIDMADVIQVDDCAQFPRLFIFNGRRIIGAEHDMLARYPDPLRQHKLCERAAVGAETQAAQKLHELWIGAGFDRKVFLKIRRPGKCIKEPARVFPDAALIIEMKRCGVSLDDLLNLRFGKRELLLCHDFVNL